MNNHAEAQMANIALKFLERCDLKGNELRAFTMVVDWLQAKARAENEPDLDPIRDSPEADRDRLPESVM